MRTIGTRAMGIRTPIIREGDNLAEIVVQSLREAWESEGFSLRDGDVVGITEAVVARAQGNYATLDQIAADVRAKFPSGEIGVVHPILSRNRFAMLLKGIAQGAKRVVVQLSYPSDEVGNQLISWDDVEAQKLNPYLDLLSEAEYRRRFGQEVKHRFTGVDYVRYYGSLAPNIEIVLSNEPRHVLQFVQDVIAADIHTRARTKKVLRNAGARKVLGLDELLTASVNGSGYNKDFGLLGSNKASEERVKLFPREGQALIQEVQRRLYELTGAHVEVFVYGDGGFKDPVGGIWELADPVIAPFHTDGLVGTPNELKMKYIADNEFAHLRGEAAIEAVRDAIRKKGGLSLMGKMEAEGTTPRQLTDLLGSLCDLVSGSGDKGTPVVLIQGYFDNYAS